MFLTLHVYHMHMYIIVYVTISVSNYKYINIINHCFTLNDAKLFFSHTLFSTQK